MSTAKSPRPASTGRSMRGPLALCLLVAAGCSDRFAVEEGARRPESVVETYPPAPVCTHEPREVPNVGVTASGRPLADIVRWRDGALLVRAEPVAAGAPAALVIDRIGRTGALTPEGRTSETGEPADLLGLSAIAGAGRIHVAISRAGGRVDLLSLSLDGATEAPPRSLPSPGAEPSRIQWLGDGPLLVSGGTVVRVDGGASAEGASTSPDGGARDAEPGAGSPDAGRPTGRAALALPRGVRDIVVAGDGIGWIHGDEAGLWLSHQGPEGEPLRTVRVATDPDATVALLWAGDRYLLADRTLSSLARYVFPQAATGEPATLALGGRFVVPRPEVDVAHAAWDSSGPRHVGVAQTLGPRHIRFVDVALAGQLLDAEIHQRTEGDITSLDLAWDGRGFVLLWGEAGEGGRPRTMLTRFSCPDDA